jgi:hypothetical protein
MWEMMLALAGAFMSGWYLKGINEHMRMTEQTSKPEMMWFNDEKTRWERITLIQLHTTEKSVIAVPVKVAQQSENYESR